MIQLERCTKLFGSALALNSISLSISGSGLTLVLGGNGAGKSTLLRACAGLLTPSSGSICSKDAVSYCGHHNMLYPQLSVAENLKFFTALQTSSGWQEDIAWLEIEDLSSKFVADLSQGQRARVNLARSLIGGKGALLLDEPSSAFDQGWQRVFVQHLQRLSLDRLVMLVTHDPEAFLSFASRVLILSQGSIKSDFNSEQLKDREAILASYREVLR